MVRDTDTFIRGTSSLEQRMIDLLRDSVERVVSGTEIAAALKVSRTAVWKHVKSLKAQGYCIESLPSRGYRFRTAPDRLTALELTAGLGTKRIGCRVESVRETDSTNLLAFHLGEEGAVEGSIVVADSQTGGKGRLGRRWESPAGVNLYCSVILRPPILPTKASQLTFLSAVAVARAIEVVTSLKAQIKWPNDILVNGMKVSGLLNEMSAETDVIHFVVLGVGVNINMGRDQFPDELRHPASSLMLESGKKVNRTGFCRAFLEELDVLYDMYLNSGFENIRQEWISRSTVEGRSVRVTSGAGVVEGKVLGIDDDGALLLDRENGVPERILAGDVTVL